MTPRLARTHRNTFQHFSATQRADFILSAPVLRFSLYGFLHSSPLTRFFVLLASHSLPYPCPSARSALILLVSVFFFLRIFVIISHIQLSITLFLLFFFSFDFYSCFLIFYIFFYFLFPYKILYPDSFTVSLKINFFVSLSLSLAVFLFLLNFIFPLSFTLPSSFFKNYVLTCLLLLFYYIESFTIILYIELYLSVPSSCSPSVPCSLYRPPSAALVFPFSPFSRGILRRSRIDSVTAVSLNASSSVRVSVLKG